MFFRDYWRSIFFQVASIVYRISKIQLRPQPLEKALALDSKRAVEFRSRQIAENQAVEEPEDQERRRAADRRREIENSAKEAGRQIRQRGEAAKDAISDSAAGRAIGGFLKGLTADE